MHSCMDPPPTETSEIYFLSIFFPSREKLVRMSSQDFGRDLQGVQNLLKKHRRLEGELVAHEPAIQVGLLDFRWFIQP